ncbi:MAG TPA: hypothetical protein VH186_35180 [Chloroflexia bacterium]|nr:hypothetical protein [Chloroflexia bacterium]
MQKEQLELFRQRLLDKKQELLAELERLGRDIQENAQDQYQEGTIDSDVATDVFEQECMLVEEDMLRYNLREIEHALHKMQDGTYGFSDVSGKPIPQERLEVLPWANRLVDEEVVFSGT